MQEKSVARFYFESNISVPLELNIFGRILLQPTRLITAAKLIGALFTFYDCVLLFLKREIIELEMELSMHKSVVKKLNFLK